MGHHNVRSRVLLRSESLLRHLIKNHRENIHSMKPNGSQLKLTENCIARVHLCACHYPSAWSTHCHPHGSPE